jgi:hypothetical protein
MIATISTRLLDGEAPGALHLGAQGEERLLRFG